MKLKLNTPTNTDVIRKVNIKDKLKELGISLDDISLGDFDVIGEYTARKTRPQDSEMYRKVGAFFRPNYERGILIYSLIKHYKVESFLEIGHGKGFSTFCAAMAMDDLGKGKVVTIDPNIDVDYTNQLKRVFPKAWFDRISFMKSTSQEVLPVLLEKETFDFVFIDGDHTYEGTKHDWEQTKDKYNKILLFDDYHLPGKEKQKYDDQSIQCAQLIDEIDDPSKHLIIGDRRIFVDDRGYSDDQINAGQVLLVHESVRDK